MKPITEIIEHVKAEANLSKLGYATTIPVIRCKNKHQFSLIFFFFERVRIEDVQYASPPATIITCNIETGEITEEKKPWDYDSKFLTHTDNIPIFKKQDKDFFEQIKLHNEQAAKKLDDIRREILQTGVLKKDSYLSFLTDLLFGYTKEFQDIFFTLSKIYARNDEINVVCPKCTRGYVIDTSAYQDREKFIDVCPFCEHTTTRTYQVREVPVKMKELYEKTQNTQQLPSAEETTKEINAEEVTVSEKKEESLKTEAPAAVQEEQTVKPATPSEQEQPKEEKPKKTEKRPLPFSKQPQEEKTVTEIKQSIASSEQSLEKDDFPYPKWLVLTKQKALLAKTIRLSLISQNASPLIFSLHGCTGCGMGVFIKHMLGFFSDDILYLTMDKLTPELLSIPGKLFVVYGYPVNKSCEGTLLQKLSYLSKTSMLCFTANTQMQKEFFQNNPILEKKVLYHIPFPAYEKEMLYKIFASHAAYLGFQCDGQEKDYLKDITDANMAAGLARKMCFKRQLFLVSGKGNNDTTLTKEDMPYLLQ